MARSLQKSAVVLLLTLCCVSEARWRPYRPPSSALEEPPVKQTENWFNSQRIDHFNPFDLREFSQRYFVDDSNWAKPDGPVIFNICGEYTCEGVFPFRQFPIQLAQQNKALVVSLEHRFYGMSQPFNNLATEHLQYLTVEQALEDLALFTSFFQQVYINAPNNKTTNNKWFIVGGSYPGALAGWYRQKYPHLSVGALASSGVVNAILEYTQFDEQVAASASRSGDDCVAALQQATLEVELGMPSVKSLFQAQSLDDGDFYFLIADAVAEGVQYGHREEVCGQMIKALKANTSLVNQLANYTTQFFYAVMGNAASDYDSSILADPNYDPLGGGRQWSWQTCSQLAYFQVAPSIGPIRSRHLGLDYFQSMCSQIFPEFQTFPPDVQTFNVAFGGPAIAGTNIIFTNGVEDPWRWASVPPPTDTKHSLAPTETSIVIDCPQCAHCVELYTPTPQDAQPLVDARVLIAKTLQQWFAEGKPIYL